MVYEKKGTASAPVSALFALVFLAACLIAFNPHKSITQTLIEYFGPDNAENAILPTSSQAINKLSKS